MQTRFRKIKGYITIYLALSFGVIMPLLLALIEGAEAGTTRLQSQLVADLGMDSVFAEYHKELYRQYGLFFIDDSYGAREGSISQVEKHLEDYMAYNTAQKETLPGYYSFQRLRKEYLEIEEVSFATDENADVWKAQAISYMKDRYGLGIIEDVKNNVQTVHDNGLIDTNIENNLAQANDTLHEILEQKKKEDENFSTGQEQDGVSFQKVFDAIGNWKSQNILGIVLQDAATVSNAGFDKNRTISGRKENNNCNVGSGIYDEKNKPEGMTEELLYDAFIMEKYGNYRKPKDDSCLAYEVEYILFGKEKDQLNLAESAQKLLLLREISNYLYLNTKDEGKKAEVRALCTAVCTLCGVPELSEVFTQVTLGIWAYAEAISDVKCLFQGQKVSLMKTADEWNLSLWSIFVPDAWRNEGNSGSQKMTALSYEDYLKIFLGTMDSNQKIWRSLDIVELDIRNTAGNSNFRIDQCIDACYVSFGFRDSYGHEYVFQRRMRYE